jgi:magnesium-protoporphyrin O-methyltransferase
MKCCQCQGIETIFDKSSAEKELKKYKKNGPSKSTALIINTLEKMGVKGLTLLDIGGGIGLIQKELINSGVKSSITVEASKAYIEISKSLTQQRDISDQVSYIHGDFVELAASIPVTDIVTLDRVICCYHDMKHLVQLSAEKTKKYYGLVYPRDNRLMKILFPLFNLYPIIKRNPFRVFIHSTNAVDKIIRKNGFKNLFHKKTVSWQVFVYERVTE